MNLESCQIFPAMHLQPRLMSSSTALFPCLSLRITVTESYSSARVHLLTVLNACREREPPPSTAKRGKIGVLSSPLSHRPWLYGPPFPKWVKRWPFPANSYSGGRVVWTGGLAEVSLVYQPPSKVIFAFLKVHVAIPATNE